MQGVKKLLVVMLLVSVSLLAAGLGTAQNGVPVKELSLQQAIDLALKNNPDMELAKIDVDSAQLSYKGAKDAADDVDADTISTLQTYQTKWITPRQRQKSLTLATEQQKVDEKTLKVNVEKAYYNVLKNLQILEVKKATLKYSQDQLKIAQDSLKVGSMSKGDVIGVEATVAAAQAGVTKAQNDYDIAVMEFNKLVGLDFNTPLKLTASFEFVKATDIKVEEAVYDALSSNLAIISVKEDKVVKQLEFEAEQKFYGGGVTSYETAKLAQRSADIAVKKQELDTTLAVRKAYLTLLATEQQINYNKKEVEKLQENHRILVLKYKAGLATGQDAQKATIDLEDARQKLVGAIFDYNALKSAFKYGLF